MYSLSQAALTPGHKTRAKVRREGRTLSKLPGPSLRSCRLFGRWWYRRSGVKVGVLGNLVEDVFKNAFRGYVSSSFVEGMETAAVRPDISHSLINDSVGGIVGA